MARALLSLLKLRPRNRTARTGAAARDGAGDGRGALPRRGAMKLGLLSAAAALLPWRPRRRRRRGEAPPTGWFGHC